MHTIYHPMETKEGRSLVKMWPAPQGTLLTAFENCIVIRLVEGCGLQTSHVSFFLLLFLLPPLVLPVPSIQDTDWCAMVSFA